MMKATGKGSDGRDTLYIGLSFGNLDKFKAAPLDSFIQINGKEMGLSCDVVIFAGRTEADMVDMMAGGFGPETKVCVTTRLKS